MSITSKVRQTVVLTADGNLQSLIVNNTAVPTTGTATNIKKINIMNIFGMATAADAEIKIYDEADDSKTAFKLVFHVKFSNADNHGQSFVVPGEGIYCNAGMYVDLTNCDFCVIIGTFT